MHIYDATVRLHKLLQVVGFGVFLVHLRVGQVWPKAVESNLDLLRAHWASYQVLCLSQMVTFLVLPRPATSLPHNVVGISPFLSNDDQFQVVSRVFPDSIQPFAPSVSVQHQFFVDDSRLHRIAHRSHKDTLHL